MQCKDKRVIQALALLNDALSDFHVEVDMDSMPVVEEEAYALADAISVLEAMGTRPGLRQTVGVEEDYPF